MWFYWLARQVLSDDCFKPAVLLSTGLFGTQSAITSPLSNCHLSYMTVKLQFCCSVLSLWFRKGQMSGFILSMEVPLDATEGVPNVSSFQIWRTMSKSWAKEIISVGFNKLLNCFLYAEMTTSLWYVKAADHPKVMDLTKAERCDWSNRSVMIDKNQSWQTDAQPQLLLDTWTEWFDRQAGGQKPWWRSFIQQHIYLLDCMHVRVAIQSI